MAEQSNTNKSSSENKGKSHRIPIVSFWLKLVTKVITLSLFAGGILIACELFLYFYLDDAISQSMLRYEGVSNFAQTGTWFDERNFIKKFEEWFIAYIDIPSLLQVLERYSLVATNKLGSSESSSDLLNTFHSIAITSIEAIPELVKLWVIVTFTWLAKILTIFAMLLPCSLIIFGGLVDGTVERKINTFKGKRDSQDKIEWWFLAFKGSTFTVLFLYIAIPNSLQATVVMLPSAVLTAFFVRGVAASYKKYW